MNDFEKYRMQKVHAKARGIEFILTFDEWFSWWKNTGKYHLRGKRGDEYCMCRKGDDGPYSLDNIYCATNIQNNCDAKINGKLVSVAGFKGKKHTAETKLKISATSKERNGLTPAIIKERIALYKTFDFTKRGAVVKFADALGVTHTQARRFINKHINTLID